jgi:hypothetical protein
MKFTFPESTCRADLMRELTHREDTSADEIRAPRLQGGISTGSVYARMKYQTTSEVPRRCGRLALSTNRTVGDESLASLPEHALIK